MALPRPSKVTVRIGSRRNFEAVPWAVCLAATLAALRVSDFLIADMPGLYPPPPWLHQLRDRESLP